jgi:elongation factor Ts
MSKKITMELIKELRAKTQVGMMDCKKALISTDGDIERAIELLRKKGASVAAKRAEHITNNGRITAHISDDHKVGALLEISCETDFSANTQDMKDFSAKISEHIAKTETRCKEWCDPAALAEQKYFGDESKTIKMLLEELIAKISENIKITRCARFEAKENGVVNAYIHPGSTLGTIVELKIEPETKNKETIVQLAREICMQIAVTNPICLDPSELNQEDVQREECIVKEQLKDSKKPPAIVEKIIFNKMNKFYEEVCLLNQKYIKDESLTVDQLIKKAEKETNSKIEIKEYKRFAIGK